MLSKGVVQSNTATVAFDAGGCVWNTENLTINGSTISGNMATGSNGNGGCLWRRHLLEGGERLELHNFGKLGWNIRRRHSAVQGPARKTQA